MTWIQSMQKAIDFMEQHLLEDISMEEIAQTAHTSPFHFQRIFSLLTDTTVVEYLRRRRLTLAAQELRKGGCKIIDVAYTYGYETPESFSRAFRKQHGISPREARSYRGKMTAYNRLVIQVNLKGADPMEYEVVEKNAFQVVGVKEQFCCVGEEENVKGIPEMWDRVNGDGTDLKLLKHNNGPVKGLLGVCEDKNEDKPNHIDYWIAVAHEGGEVEGLESLDVPKAKWAVFGVRGAMPHAMQETWKKIYSEWFPSSGYENAGGPELEVYHDGNPNSEDYYSEIWIPVK
ncbi:AraC family transcriptional regulator [Halobacillus sp. Nhm2S1]|uniref:AraC family transcriptional regulator n=1 Tax=Halobacillus sp. Nhm2S1 TaxID=2866716 RepID=UPI001C73DFC6|nr:AraC family transcriptional regulator [Halobacillus sp. Nhm2S1]MBX0358543.1 AraC family transcriptional regulator [Halobacillus sp. Nhm2S1]